MGGGTYRSNLNYKTIVKAACKLPVREQFHVSDMKMCALYRLRATVSFSETILQL